MRLEILSCKDLRITTTDISKSFYLFFEDNYDRYFKKLLLIPGHSGIPIKKD